MDFSKLNKQQLSAATYSGKHLLVLAGAGTGKTKTIIARVVHLISTGIQPNRIKILSFTKKSAQEIAERIKIETLNIPETKQITGSTFHSWCMELLTRYSKSFGIEEYSCIDEEDRESAIKIAFGSICQKNTITVGNERIKASTISDIYSFSVNTRVNLSTAIKTRIYPMENGHEIDLQVSEIKKQITPIIKAYIDYKRSHRYIDYDDMLMIVASVLKQNKNLRERISSLYDHILIDEMQDTNPLQWMLLESFIDKCHLFCVGDDAQSIYAFRGADFKSIHSFANRVPNSEVYKLEENYRSTQEILDLSNWLLDISPIDYNKHLYANRGKGQKPIMQFVDSSWEEAEFITNDIEKNVRWDGKLFRDHMVLSRSIFALRKIEAACISKNIPYIIFGGTSLMRSAHVRDIVAALRIIANFRDELAWMRYLTLWNGIGEVTATKIIKQMYGYSSLKECIESVRLANLKENTTYKLLQEISTLDQNIDKAIDVIVSSLDVMMSRKYENWDTRKKDFIALKIVAQRAENITAFITEYILDPIAEISNISKEITNKDCVIISTIHSAKGLEAETCYIANVKPGTFPWYKAISEEDIEEERRCLYVALTRAKDRLYIMTSLSSNTAVQNEWNNSQEIVSISDNTVTGTIKETLVQYENEIENTIVVYNINSQPNEQLEMNENEFWMHYKLADNKFDINQAYFFNNIPDNLIETVLIEEPDIQYVQFVEDEDNDYDPFNNFDFS